MSKLSFEKMRKIKQMKNANFVAIGKALGVSGNSISKMFSGERSNPQIENLLKVADYLECTVDDFIDYDNVPELPKDAKIIRISEVVSENKELQNLLKYCRDLSADEINALTNIVKVYKSQPWIQE